MDGFISFITYSIIAYLLGYWLYITVMWLRLLHLEWKGKDDPRPSLEEGKEAFYRLTDEIHGKGWREKKELKPYVTKINTEETAPEKDVLSWDVKKVQIQKS